MNAFLPPRRLVLSPKPMAPYFGSERLGARRGPNATCGAIAPKALSCGRGKARQVARTRARRSLGTHAPLGSPRPLAHGAEEGLGRSANQRLNALGSGYDHGTANTKSAQQSPDTTSEWCRLSDPRCRRQDRLLAFTAADCFYRTYNSKPFTAGPILRKNDLPCRRGCKPCTEIC
jgi:hypothetical protein